MCVILYYPQTSGRGNRHIILHSRPKLFTMKHAKGVHFILEFLEIKHTRRSHWELGKQGKRQYSFTDKNVQTSLSKTLTLLKLYSGII